MSKIKRFFVVFFSVLAILLVKIASVFGKNDVDTDIWGMGKNFIDRVGGRTATLYGTPDWEFEENVLPRILITIICILVPAVVLGIVAYLKLRKKQKQQAQNNQQNTQQNNNIQK